MALAVFISLFAAFSAGVAGQSSNSYGCLPHAAVTSLTACDQLSTTISSCFAVSTATASIESCFCKQPVLNKIVDCESEMRLCYDSDQFDYYAQDILSNWDDWCTDYITYTPTLPVLSTPTTTVPSVLPPFCSEFTTSCAMWSASESACLNLDPSATASSFLDCACSTDLLSLASVCLYDVAVSCVSESTALSDIALFSICGTTYSNDQLITAATLGGAMTAPAATPSPASPASRTVASASSTPAQLTQSSSTQPVGTSSQGAAAATSSNASANMANTSPLGSRLLASGILALLYLW